VVSRIIDIQGRSSLSDPLTFANGMAGASFGQLSAAHFLRRLFAELDGEQIRYCVLHGFSERLESDLDIAVAPGEFDRLAGVFGVLQRQGYRLVQRLNYDVNAYYFVFAWLEESVQVVAVDVISEHREGKLILMSGDDLLRGRRRQGDFWIPSPSAAFHYLLAKKVLKRALSAAQSAELANLAREIGREDAERICVKLFGRAWGIRAAERIVDGRLETFLPALKRRLWATTLIRKPWMPVWYWISDAPRILSRVRRRSGLLVAVLGSDGAGKSTLIENLRSGFSRVFRRDRVFHWRPGLVFRTRSGIVANPHERPCRGYLQSLLPLFAHFVDHCLGYVFRVYPLLCRSGFALFDRYFHDLVADPKRYRYGGSHWAASALAGLVPRPDLMLILDVPPDAAMERKSETSIEELVRTHASYQKLLRCEFARRIDASRSAEAVASESSRIILDLLHKRLCPHFLALPSRANPRWLIPPSGNLDLYTPYRFTGHLLKAAMSLTLGIPWWPRETARFDTPDDLVRAIFGTANAKYSVALGTPGRYRKAVIGITTGDHKLGYLKLPLTEEATDRVKNEAAMLTRLAAVDGMRGRTPRVLYAGEWNGRFVLLQGPLQGAAGHKRLKKEHHEFLSALADVEYRARHVGDLLGDLHVPGAAPVDQAMEFIEKHYSGLAIPCGITHGDFAPWNTRHHDGNLSAFDWERAEARRPLDWDLLHFQFQTASLLGRNAGYRIDRTSPAAHCSYLLYLIYSLGQLVDEQSGEHGIRYRLAALRKEIRRDAN